MEPLRAATASAAGAALWSIDATRRARVAFGVPPSVGTWLYQTLLWQHHNLRYRGSADTTFIVSFPKSGTTLMQMLMYQLTTDGSMDFKHLNQFAPFLERDLMPQCARMGKTIEALSAPIMKSHLPYRLIPKGPGRYIYVMRNGLDVAVSLYYQVVRTGFGGSFNEFFKSLHTGRLPVGSWFDHVARWSDNSRRLNVLYITYEQLRAHFTATARRIADFCEIAVADADWTRIASNCSFEAMRSHEVQIDDFGGAARYRVDPTDLHFVRRGRVGDWRSMVSPDLVQMFDAQFERRLAHRALPSYLGATARSVTEA